MRRDQPEPQFMRLPRRLVAIQFGAVALLTVVCGAATLWVAHQHDRLAASSTRQMIAGGVAALEEKLRTTTLDYSVWDDAFEKITQRDREWIWTNIGSGAAELGTTDLMVIVAPGGTAHSGWTYGMGETPSAEVLPAATLEPMLQLLDSVPTDAMEAVTRYAVVDGMPWLLSVARVRPSGELPASLTDAELPRHVFGFRLDTEQVVGLGAQFLVDNLRATPAPSSGEASFALRGFDGEPVAFLTWDPPRPGNQILQSIGPALALVLAAIVAVTAFTSRHAVHTARRLLAAEQADREKTAFLANVSHELRTPMNGILGMGQLIQATPLEPKVARMMDVLMSSAHRQLALIEDLLNISRIDSGAVRLATEPFDPAGATAEICDLLAPRAEEKGIDLRRDLPAAGRFTVLGDKGRYQQVVTNLLGNAIKFTEEGHVAIRLRAHESGGRTHLSLSVADSGPGIESKDHERIFERFVQATSGAHQHASGTGLGLAITRSLVELMGGTLRLASEPGEGAEFSVDLTLTTSERDEAALAAE